MTIQPTTTIDSSIDVLLHSNSPLISESLTSVICKCNNPLIQSHHDVILSTFTLSPAEITPLDENITAPKIDNNRVKILWSDEGIVKYQEYVGVHLTRLRETWSDPSSPASMSILLSSTYSLLSSAATQTNKSISLSEPPKPKPRHFPEIQKLQKVMINKHKSLKQLLSAGQDNLVIFEANQEYLKSKKCYEKASKQLQRADPISRDLKLDNILITLKSPWRG